MNNSGMLLIGLLISCTAALQSNANIRNVIKTPSKKALGSTVALTEGGYQQLVALNSTSQMKLFVRRLLDKMGRKVNDEGAFNGILPFYSGEQSVQTLDDLKAELQHAIWVDPGVGRSAPLSEDGYQAVVKEPKQFKAFARRILEADGKKVVDEGAFSGIVPYYNGEVSVQTFSALQEELRSAPWVQSVVSWSGATGSNVPLSEDGYLRVVALKSDIELQEFVRRLLSSEAKLIDNEFGLSEFVRVCGTTEVKTLSELRKHLKDKTNSWWIGEGEGRTADLSADGYNRVVAGKSDAQMKAFARRLLRASGRKVVDEGALNGFVPYFSGRTYATKFDDFKKELLGAAWQAPL